MSRSAFIRDLVDLVGRIDCGMVVFELPLPKAVHDNLKKALVSFGEEAVPFLHHALTTLPPECDPQLLIDVMGMIGSKESADYLIDFHRNRSSFISGLKAINAMRNLKCENSYTYLSEIVARYSDGDVIAFNSNTEILIASEALGEWHDQRAIVALLKATGITDVPGLPETAIQALARHPNVDRILSELIASEPRLRHLISAYYDRRMSASPD